MPIVTWFYIHVGLWWTLSTSAAYILIALILCTLKCTAGLKINIIISFFKCQGTFKDMMSEGESLWAKKKRGRDWRAEGKGLGGWGKKRGDDITRSLHNRISLARFLQVTFSHHTLCLNTAKAPHVNNIPLVFHVCARVDVFMTICSTVIGL